VLDAADCVVFIADHLRERLSGDVPLPERTEVIYNPVEIDVDFQPIEFDRPTSVSASFLSESKGVGTAVRAMGRVTDEHPDAQLIVFGDGPLRGELESLAADVAPGAVEFRGRVDPSDVYAAMAGATATVFPSVWDEPFGRVMVESMMLGTPVVGSQVGGIAEVIEDGETGLLFPAEDEGVLAEKVRSLCRDDDLRGRITELARTATDRFQPEHGTRAHVECYRSLIE
jgi:glycosyltransferase involved in cell wall biosynthesis